MQYVPLVPSAPPLAGAVEVIFALAGYRPEHRTERLVPNGRVNLVIELDGRERHIYDNETRASRQVCREAWLSGVHSRYLTIGETQPESRLAAVQFAPGRSLPWVQQALQAFNDKVVPAVEVFGDSVLELRKALVESETAAIPDAIEGWLVDRYDGSFEPPRVLRQASTRLLENPGEVRLTRLVDEDGSVSYKHFLELFKRHFGPNPKTMQRILRFAGAFEALQAEEGVDWASLSLELGYSDQAHFIRDFRAFSGYRPKRFVEAENERINFFPDDPVE